MTQGQLHISHPERLEQKILKIKKAGVSQFHVVADFDNTLTPAFVDGKKAETGVGQIRAGGYLTPTYAPRAYALKDKYYPIEIDESRSIEERSKEMLKWWTEHLALMIECGLNREVIQDIIDKGKMLPRGGTHEFYKILHSKEIPLLIFSAGKGDLIEGFLRHEGVLFENTHIISNFYDYDEKGFVKGYKGAIIHSFNKNEGQAKNTPYHSQVKNRRNVLLLGDKTGDLGMIEGLEHDTVIRVGFLNENVEKLLDAYSKAFDVVILNDGSMGYVNTLLKKLV